jgi:hypothetical protein
MNIIKQNLSRSIALGFLPITVLITGILFQNQPSYAQTTAPEPATESQANPQESSKSQGEISQEELQQFAQAYKQIQQIKQDSERQMVEAVKNQGLSPERFIQISELDQNSQAEGDNPVSKEEKQSFENAKNQILEIRQQSESQMAEAIQSKGLDITRFNQIITALQQNSNLRQQVQQLIVN